MMEVVCKEQITLIELLSHAAVAQRAALSALLLQIVTFSRNSKR
jgi:hypothetical protein